MTKTQLDKLWSVIGKLEALQREMLRSPRHEHDTAIEDMERAKTSLLIAYNRGT